MMKKVMRMNCEEMHGAYLLMVTVWSWSVCDDELLWPSSVCVLVEGCDDV